MFWNQIYGPTFVIVFENTFIKLNQIFQEECPNITKKKAVLQEKSRKLFRLRAWNISPQQT
jgi:hypothetical protein